MSSDSSNQEEEPNRAAAAQRRVTTFLYEIEEKETTWTAKLKKFGQFIGPGMMVSIAYIDPGNYSTDVSAGAIKKYSLLFVIVISTFFGVILQVLAVQLGCITGADLAVNCRRHMPKYLIWFYYILAEAAIIATDIAEVIGTAVALNVLMHIPLMAGIALTTLDVILVLMAYRPGKGMMAVRRFEQFVMLLLAAVVICFIVELIKMPRQPVGPIFRGFLPSSDMITDNGMYLSCGILGATVMPHSLYLGSSLVKPRIWHRDKETGYLSEEDQYSEKDDYKPSYDAIRYALKYSVAEVVFSLCTFALFVNASILILAGAILYQQPGASNADLYSIYDMLVNILSKAAGIIFMLALLFSGESAGIVCTLAGQIVAEGHMKWKFKPWKRRIITRLIAIFPCLVVTGVVGKNGLGATLNASQVALCILLPFLALPLVYFTSSSKIMCIHAPVQGNPEVMKEVSMASGWIMKTISWLIWVFLLILNVYLIIHMAMYGA